MTFGNVKIWFSCFGDFEGNRNTLTNTPTLELIYHTLAYPHLQYCISSWGGASKTTLNSLLIKQKIITRIILKKPYLSPSKPLFEQLQFLKIQQIYQYKIGILMHKNKSNIIQMSSDFLFITDIHSYNTRSSSNNDYFIPKARINLKQTSFIYRGPDIWNKIPPDIRTTPFFFFKKLFKSHLLSQQESQTN